MVTVHQLEISNYCENWLLGSLLLRLLGSLPAPHAIDFISFISLFLCLWDVSFVQNCCVKNERIAGFEVMCERYVWSFTE